MENEIKKRIADRKQRIDELRDQGQKTTGKLAELYALQKNDMTKLLVLQTKKGKSKCSK